MMFVLAMAILFWILGCYGAWIFFRRGKFWRAVLPPGLVMLINIYLYSGKDHINIYMAVYVLLVLILVMRSNLIKHLDLWHRERVQVSPSMSFQFSRAGFLVALVLVGFSWGAPAFAQSDQALRLWDSISDPFRRINDRVGDIFGNIRSPEQAIYDVYGDRLMLDVGFEPVDGLIMSVKTKREPISGARFYWRARTYAIFQDGSWSETIGERVEFRPEEGNLPLKNYAARTVIEVYIEPKKHAMHTFNLPTQPLWVNYRSKVTLTRDENGIVDVAMVTAKGTFYEGEQIHARAVLAVPTADELRTSGQEYPEWVAANYLQLPDTITPRTIELAKTIVNGIDNPYKQAKEITQWLRDNIDYSRVIDLPPEGVESLDWFLFDYKAGFCTWYASAEVIMLRSLGIPARIAVGYARGTYDIKEESYAVHAKDAHAWPEVFFPEYGWVEFEPTANQAILIRPEPQRFSGSIGRSRNPWARLDENAGLYDSRIEEVFIFDEITGNAGNMASKQIGVQSILLIALGVIAALFAAAFLWMRIDPFARMTAAGAILTGFHKVGIKPPPSLQRIKSGQFTPAEEIYVRWNHWLMRLGIPWAPWQTPYERAAAFAEVMPDSSQAGWAIVKAYTGERYGNIQADRITVRQTWKNLRRSLLQAWIHNIIAKIINRSSRSINGS
jgi:transglutaminase-like putative cysteine protease